MLKRVGLLNAFCIRNFNRGIQLKATRNFSGKIHNLKNLLKFNRYPRKVKLKTWYSKIKVKSKFSKPILIQTKMPIPHKHQLLSKIATLLWKQLPIEIKLPKNKYILKAVTEAVEDRPKQKKVYL